MSDSIAPTDLLCRRCGRPVEAERERYDVFEQMHYTCFHYEFEHDGDPDVECHAGGCPAAGLTLPMLWLRIKGVDLVQGRSTIAPALLVLSSLGFELEISPGRVVARLHDARFEAADPVGVLGLVKLAELRRPWRATEVEVQELAGLAGIDPGDLV